MSEHRENEDNEWQVFPNSLDEARSRGRCRARGLIDSNGVLILNIICRNCVILNAGESRALDKGWMLYISFFLVLGHAECLPVFYLHQAIRYGRP